MRGRASRLALTAGIAALLSGCAVAIPIVAAGALANKQMRKHRAAQATGTPVAVATKSRRKPRPARTVVTAATPVETPAPQAAPVVVAERSQDTGAWHDFVAYAVGQHRAGLDQAEGEEDPRRSAILASPVSLENPSTLPCDARSSAVIVDMDALPAARGTSGSAQLAAAIAQLRQNKITVLWLTDGSASASDGVWPTLAANGVPMGLSDRLLAVGPTGSRKQELRQSAANEFCVLAIAGSRRADMDELYDYLKTEDDGFHLKRFWGAGWFLIPTVTADPLTPKDVHALDSR